MSLSKDKTTFNITESIDEWLKRDTNKLTKNKLEHNERIDDLETEFTEAEK